MKLTTGILFLGMVAGTALGQNLDVMNTRNTMKAVQQKKAMDSDAALASSQGSSGNPKSVNSSPLDSGAPASGPSSAARQPKSKAVAVKVKSSAGHKKAEPKQEIAAAATGP